MSPDHGSPDRLSSPALTPQARTGSVAPAPVSEWEIDRLRHSARQGLFLAHAALIGLAIVGICAAVFLYYQISLLSAQAAEMAVRTRALAQSLQQFETNAVPGHAAFIQSMRAVADTDPQFAGTFKQFSQAMKGLAGSNASFRRLIEAFPDLAPRSPNAATNSSAPPDSPTSR